MTNPKELKELLVDDCVMVYQNSESTMTLSETGIKNIIHLADHGFRGGVVADIVVGKAAAMVMAYMEVESIWANLISLPAIEVLERFNIPCQYETSVDYIINRRGDGLCPMEQKVINLTDPKEAYELLKSIVG